MAEITYSTVYDCHELLTWLWATLCSTACMSFTMKALAAAALGLHWSDIMVTLHEVMLWQPYGYIMVMLRLQLQLPCQPGERLSCGCCASQERINMSAVPTVPQVFFQPLSSWLAYSGFSRQWKRCEQQENWHHKQKQRHTGIGKNTTPKALSISGFPGGSNGKESACNEEDNKNH